MTTSESSLDPPYLLETDSTFTQTVSAYQAISFHPTKRDVSFEELRLEHYNIGRKEPTTDSSDTSNLMATRQLSALSTVYPVKSIRAVAGGFNKYLTR